MRPCQEIGAMRGIITVRGLGRQGFTRTATQAIGEHKTVGGGAGGITGPHNTLARRKSRVRLIMWRRTAYTLMRTCAVRTCRAVRTCHAVRTCRAIRTFGKEGRGCTAARAQGRRNSVYAIALCAIAVYRVRLFMGHPIGRTAIIPIILNPLGARRRWRLAEREALVAGGGIHRAHHHFVKQHFGAPAQQIGRFALITRGRAKGRRRFYRHRARVNGRR
jgi:hypothetical protein